MGEEVEVEVESCHREFVKEQETDEILDECYSYCGGAAATAATATTTQSNTRNLKK